MTTQTNTFALPEGPMRLSELEERVLGTLQPESPVDDLVMLELSDQMARTLVSARVRMCRRNAEPGVAAPTSMLLEFAAMKALVADEACYALLHLRAAMQEYGTWRDPEYLELLQRACETFISTVDEWHEDQIGPAIDQWIGTLPPSSPPAQASALGGSQ